MKQKLLITVIILLNLYNVKAQVQVTKPLCENMDNPIGLDTKSPRFSWKLESAKRNTSQTSYEIRVSESNDALLKGKNIIWNSGKVMSGEYRFESKYTSKP